MVFPEKGQYSVATLSLSDQIAGLLLRKDHQVELEKDQEG